MTMRSALSKLLPIILRLWGVDTTTPSARHGGRAQFARATARRIYTRNGVRVTISHGDEWSGENGGSMFRNGE